MQIEEILTRSTQGITKPFICRGEDGNNYFVKGRDVGRRSLLCEWIAGNLCKALDLPIAPFTLAYVPEELLEFADLETQQMLGVGWVFASLKQEATDLEFSAIARIPEELQQKIFAFDWWIANTDRTLTKIGGNPNLLWENANKNLVIIDHN